MFQHFRVRETSSELMTWCTSNVFGSRVLSMTFHMKVVHIQLGLMETLSLCNKISKNNWQGRLKDDQPNSFCRFSIIYLYIKYVWSLQPILQISSFAIHRLNNEIQFRQISLFTIWLFLLRHTFTSVVCQ